jgi:hypothetical protein
MGLGFEIFSVLYANELTERQLILLKGPSYYLVAVLSCYKQGHVSCRDRHVGTFFVHMHFRLKCNLLSSHPSS